MWRRTYLVLLLIRVYFALSPSYLHPDENFQGPEVFAEQVYSYPAQLTWEFTSAKPIRGIFPLWLGYGLPMTFLKWFWTEAGTGNTPPYLIYYVLRGSMFGLSFVLEDWAIHELIASPRHRRQAVVLVASSFVTWTYQSHTFSNSLETLLVAWSLVVIQRILENEQRSSVLACAILAFTTVIGVFNRITFPAFIVIPAMRLIPHLWKKPFSFASLVVSGIIFSLIAVYADTSFYSSSPISLSDLFRRPIITPLNNLLYNTNKTNLASHGLHPHYQHFLVNAPQLLGPVYLLLMASIFWRTSRLHFSLANMRAISALSGATILSIFPHQEPRFLLPCVPLLLTCFKLPKSRIFLASWILFNGIMGTLMGIYHQGGVIPTQLQMPTILSDIKSNVDNVPVANGTANVFWWKTYSPPRWMLGDLANITIRTHDLMGVPGVEMLAKMKESIPQCIDAPIIRSEQDALINPNILVAPRSASFLDEYTNHAAGTNTNSERSLTLEFRQIWSYNRHLSLDDLDFGDDGILPTLKRVLGRHGLDTWHVTRVCK
ncbi:alpha 1,2 mannosyltransferase [Ophidiomyces ophidiicola]|uniref:alpha 1,2 mannosyltransferase n=1 Tax=Ophidiomyces ophidiicola TaxID=1387563 RepID=UPI0020C2119D|nr:alpha 1,2 mannosyltransferase [Ophidiomyces ophidiicola]KAI1952922.1 alpha 1,2 mannosyltransferase [Ophidiomyces ophidiicola]KAI2057569.1 alpha 1,2 mannosyltransferase [Ophidiomyces ophidiicola]